MAFTAATAAAVTVATQRSQTSDGRAAKPTARQLITGR